MVLAGKSTVPVRSSTECLLGKLVIENEVSEFSGNVRIDVFHSSNDPVPEKVGLSFFE
jgi:hypothetical protein